MTETPPPATGERRDALRAQTKITVDDPHTMVKLLGAGDEILKLIERAVASDVHVRGNEVTITGSPADNALAERIFAELLELIEKGENLTADAVRRTVAEAPLERERSVSAGADGAQMNRERRDAVRGRSRRGR